MSLIIDSQPFPCIDYFKKLIKETHAKIDIYESFQKMTFRNRYMIAGANGVINLSIPLVGGREQKTLMKDIKIDYASDWQVQHWRGLLSSYQKAPFFEFYAENVKSLIFSNETFLYSFNFKILDWLFKLLNINSLVEFTDRFIANYELEEDSRNLFLPKNYNTGREKWKPAYLQVFEDRLGFQPNLSILDLIFCEGPNSINLLKNSLD